MLLEKYDGKFENCIKSVGGSAKQLLDLIVREFKCYRDEADYEDKRVSIYKRAQILIGDIWACFHGKGVGQFDDIQEITMFADYRVPQVLIHFGCLEYTAELLEHLKKGIYVTVALISENDILFYFFLEKPLVNGSPEEVEIRCASIYIVEQVKKIVLQNLEQNHPELPLIQVNSILIDHFLWDYRRKYAKELEYIPFHQTVCIYY